MFDTFFHKSFRHNRYMEIIDKLINSLEVRVEPFAICDVRCGNHLNIESDEYTTIHYVLAGTGNLIINRNKKIDLQSDQMILIPKGLEQRIESLKSDSESVSKPSLCLQPAESIHWLKAGSGTTDIILACGRIHVTYGHDVNIFDFLAEPLIKSFQESNYIRNAFEAMLLEFSKPQLGTIALASTLMKQCLILLLRRLHAEQDWRIPWLAVVENPRLENALRAILDAPEKNHTVEMLAELSFMSRSTFTEHFTKAFGQPPHDFLTNYRLRRAAQLLSTSNIAVETIANQVGYHSRSSFSRAFKSLYKEDPTTYRNNKNFV